MLSGGFDGMFNHENWDHHLSTMIFHDCHGGIMRISQWKSRTAGLVHEASYWVYGRYIKLIKNMGTMATTGFASQKLPCENTGKFIYQTNSVDGAEPTSHYPCTCRVLWTQPQQRNNVLLRNRRVSHNTHNYIILYICLLLTVCTIYICICIYIVFI